MNVGVDFSYRAALELGNVVAQRHSDRYLPFLQRILDKLPLKVCSRIKGIDLSVI